jgi:hypothetical protein
MREYLLFLCVLLLMSVSRPPLLYAETGGAPAGSGAVDVRFGVESEGTVIDNETGLMWLKDADFFGGALPWQVAQQYIAEMNEGKRENFGHTDWRLPAIKELSSLIEEGRSYPALPGGNPFVNVSNGYYWSSTGGVNVVSYAWTADMGSGSVRMDYISFCNFLSAWPVRATGRAPVKDMSDIKVTVAPSAPGLQSGGFMCEENTGGGGAPLPPVGVSATATSPEEVVLVWQAGEGGGGKNIAWYNIYQNDRFIKSVPSTTHAFVGLQPDSRYCYSVSSYNDAGLESEKSAQSCTVTWSSPASRTVWAAGDNGSGQVGDGTRVDRPTLVLAQGVSGAVRIAAGMEHSVAVGADGSVWAWGSNGRGQLGDGTSQYRLKPGKLEGISDVVDVAAGWYHTVALKSDGTVWAWGRNYYGQLGTGGNADSSAPVRVGGLSGVKKIASGWYHCLALKSDGTVWAWGWNLKGQTGPEDEGGNSNTPVRVAGIDDVVDISAGMYHSVALRSDGSVLAWGANEYGQLGTGNELDSPMPMKVEGLSEVSQVAGGMNFTIALKTDGNVWAWGKNDYGQLGSDSLPVTSTPVKVSGIGDVIRVAAGSRHAGALKSNGTVWVWGRKSSYPFQLSGVRGISDIKAGINFTLALKGE